MVGSHIDTVRTGGRFDGNLGVLAGLEIVETLDQHGITTRRPIQVAFFTDEEGARFAPDMLGSQVYVGALAVEEALDVLAADNGARLGDELSRIGYAGPTPVPAAAFPHCYAELHIEQGPVLEREGITIGVVTGVQGISWTEVTITGQSAHAGTTPMHLRHDPMAVAARAIHELRLLAGYLGAPQVATVGRLNVVPNLVNVIPSNVVFTIDVRNTDEAILEGIEAADIRGVPGVRVGRGLRDLDAHLGSIRAGRLRRRHDRSGRGHRAAARPLHQAHAVRCRTRRPDAGAGVPDLDGLRPECQRAVAQHRRVHRAGRHRSRRQRLAPGRSRPRQLNFVAANRPLGVGSDKVRSFWATARSTGR